MVIPNKFYSKKMREVGKNLFQYVSFLQKLVSQHSGTDNSEYCLITSLEDAF